MNGGVQMRLSRALTRGRWLPLLAAGMVGYVLGDWHTIAMRTAQLSASQNIALRFPEANAEPVADAELAPPLYDPVHDRAALNEVAVRVRDAVG